MKKLALALIFGLGAWAQNPVQFQPTTVAPTGQACNSTRGAELTPNGVLYTCQFGVMAAVSGGGGGSGTVTSITFNPPLTGGTISTTGTVGIPQADGSTNGFLASSDWTIFNNKIGFAYQTIDVSAVALQQRSTVNLIPGTNTSIVCADNLGTLATDCTFGYSGGVSPNYTQSFVAQTTVILTDNAATLNKVVACYDNSTPPNVLFPQNIALTDTNNTTVTFGSAQTGNCVVNSSGNTGGGGGGGPGSVLGIATKTANYTTVSTDYTILCSTGGGGFTVSMDAAPSAGEIHIVKNIGGNTCTVSGNGANIDGAATQTIDIQNMTIQVQWDGTQWQIISRFS